MRNAFADEITKLSQSDPRVVLMSSDIGNRLFDRYKEAVPGRFFNCGIAEANMMGIAAGMAMSGYRPVVYTITPFTTTRCLEQIRVDVCYHEAPVIIVGMGAGLSYAQLGPTHHSCEDIALLRVLPNMTVFCPADSVELRLGLRAALEQDRPVYIRIGKKGEPVLHDGEPPFELGKALTLRDGADVCLIGTGTIMPVLLAAASDLDAAGISARVENFHTVKPLDSHRLRQLFERFPLIAIAEEHSKIGGLYGAIAEWWAAQADCPGRLINFGVEDLFMHEVGTQDYAREKFGLTAGNVAGTVSEILGGQRD